MNKLIEKLLYSFGINLSCYNVKYELNLLKENLPDSFKGRDVVDIGCGAGKVSLKLKEVVKSRTFEGIDLSKPLVESAKKRGLDASVLDVENQDLSGDLGVLWGVVHHFEDPIKTLKKIHKNFKLLIIRESIDDKRLFECGNRFNEEKLMKILTGSGIKIDQCKIVKSKKTKSLIIFLKVTD